MVRVVRYGDRCVMGVPVCTEWLAKMERSSSRSIMGVYYLGCLAALAMTRCSPAVVWILGAGEPNVCVSSLYSYLPRYLGSLAQVPSMSRCFAPPQSPALGRSGV